MNLLQGICECRKLRRWFHASARQQIGWCWILAPKRGVNIVDSTLAFVSRLLFSSICASEKPACLIYEVAGYRLGSRPKGLRRMPRWYAR